MERIQITRRQLAIVVGTAAALAIARADANSEVRFPIQGGDLRDYEQNYLTRGESRYWFTLSKRNPAVYTQGQPTLYQVLEVKDLTLDRLDGPGAGWSAHAVKASDERVFGDWRDTTGGYCRDAQFTIAYENPYHQSRKIPFRTEIKGVTVEWPYTLGFGVAKYRFLKGLLGFGGDFIDLSADQSKIPGRLTEHAKSTSSDRVAVFKTPGPWFHELLDVKSGGAWGKTLGKGPQFFPWSEILEYQIGISPAGLVEGFTDWILRLRDGQGPGSDRLQGTRVTDIDHFLHGIPRGRLNRR